MPRVEINDQPCPVCGAERYVQVSYESGEAWGASYNIENLEPMPCPDCGYEDGDDLKEEV